jgi:putative transposase
LELAIPKLRTGSFFPSLLEGRRRVDQALFALVMEAYLHRVSTCKVDDGVKALGIDSVIWKSERQLAPSARFNERNRPARTGLRSW